MNYPGISIEQSSSRQARNTNDRQINSCAAKSGVIGLSPWGAMVLKNGQTTRSTVDNFIDHIDYVSQLLGSTGNMGVGTDMSPGAYPDHEHDPWGDPTYKDVTSTYNTHITSNIRSPHRMVEGFAYYPEVLNFVANLKKRGYSKIDVRKILDKNDMRMFKQVWT